MEGLTTRPQQSFVFSLPRVCPKFHLFSALSADWLMHCGASPERIVDLIVSDLLGDLSDCPSSV